MTSISLFHWLQIFRVSLLTFGTKKKKKPIRDALSSVCFVELTASASFVGAKG